MGPLDGVRIIELAGIGAGPFCGMLLADLGAEVIAIERRLPSGPDAEIADNGLLRRGRRSVVIDLKQERGAELVRRLAAGATAMFEGMRPGVAERLGVGPEECMAVNPALVYGRITGWGQDGPLASAPGHDLNYLSLGGALHAIGRDRPVPPLNLVADYGGGGMLLAVGLLAGIVESRRSGRGQVVDAAMFEGANLLMTLLWDLFDKGRWTDRRSENILDGGAPFNDVYRCADGRWVAVAALEPRFRRRLLELLKIPFTEADLSLDRERWPRLRRELESAFALRTRDEWVDLLEGEEVCVTPVLSLGEAREHPHAVARGSFAPGPRDDARQPAPAPRFSVTPSATPAPPPPLGADTDAVLSELGLDRAEIDELREAGTIG